MNSLEDHLEEYLKDLKATLCSKIEVGSLISRNSVAHKWKATFRSIVIREAIAWRAQDLLNQSLVLHKTQHSLGARILLRSALETIAILIYLNQLTRKVVSGSLNFHEFSNKTSILLLGSRDYTTKHKAINIVTVLQKYNSRYPRMESLYAILSESAHPNFEGICSGYTTIDKDNLSTNFSNKWTRMYGDTHPSSIELCVSVFSYEYNNEWKSAYEKLELWIEKNDSILEATKQT